DTYRTELMFERGEQTRSSRTKDDTSRGGKAETRRVAADRRASLAPLKKAVQAAEKAIEQINREIAKLDALLADTALYASDPGRVRSAGVERGQLVKRLAQAEAEWMAASEAYEQAGAETSGATSD